MRVLNVGGGASRDLPRHFKDYEQQLLDIDANVKPDICLDARALVTAAAHRGKFDAVYCSHNLEHFYRHEVPVVLAGFLAVLKPNGFAQIAVPNLLALIDAVAEGRDLDAVWYRSGGGPITFHDVLYGWGKALAGGNQFYAHHCGFTEKSLTKELRSAGFARIWTACDEAGNLHAYAFKSKTVTRALRMTLGID